MSLRPSSLPMLDAENAGCACFESGQTGEDANFGLQRHKAYAHLLNGGKTTELFALNEQDDDAVKWAAEYTLTHAPTSDWPLLVEQKVNPVDDFGEPYFPNGGTFDAACGPEMFDLKWRFRDYEAQCAAYALGRFQDSREHGMKTGFNWPLEIRFHVLFGEQKRAQVFTFTEDSARAIVERVVNAANNPDAKATPCDYCGWCAKVLTCQAHLNDAQVIAAAREDLDARDRLAFVTWAEAGAHTSEIDDPRLMALVLRIARQLASWCDAAEFKAKEMVTKHGRDLPGFKLQTRQGNRFIENISEAFAKIGLPQSDFIKACVVQPSSLFEVYSIFHGMAKKTAEKEVESKLEGIMQRKPSTQSLVKDKTQTKE